MILISLVILEIRKFAKVFFDSLSFQAVSANSDEVDIVLSQQVLECLPIFFVLPLFFDFKRPHRLELRLQLFIIIILKFVLAVSLFAPSGWNYVQEVFLIYQFSELIDHSNSCHCISIINLVVNHSHHN